MPKSKPNDGQIAQDEAFLQQVLSFNGTVYRFDRGFELMIQIELCGRSQFRPNGFEYAFVLVGPDRTGNRVRLIGFDNAHAPKGVNAPFDHEHKERRGRDGLLLEAGRPVARPMNNIQDSILDFFEEAYALMAKEDVDVGAGIPVPTSPSEETGTPKAKATRRKSGEESKHTRSPPRQPKAKGV